MSANILWRTTGKGTDLNVNWPSKFTETMNRVFGEGSYWTIHPADAPILRGMAGTIDGEDNPYQRLYDIVLEHGEIEVWPEW